MTRFMSLSDPDFQEKFSALVASRREQNPDIQATVRAILAQVREGGDAALIDLTRRFDRLALNPGQLRLSAEEIADLDAACPPPVRAALEHAIARVTAFHTAQRPLDHSGTDAEGIESGWRWRPVDSAGLYIPGGKAAYPSTVYMNAIPAQVAGVPRIAMTVPTPDGAIHPAIVAAARLCGISEIYRIGGAQAIATLAYGTASVPAVDIIAGPGNAFVSEAQRQVFGQVGIGLVAGPSEILIVADSRNDPQILAMDLLSQAEHDETAQAILIADDPAFAQAVAAAVGAHLAHLPRAAIAGASWAAHGAVIVVGSLLRDAPALVDALAPEHLEIATENPQALFERIRHAGSVFLGRHTPESLGDYAGGPNHVLPTGRSARFQSGLGVTHFMKRTTWLCATERGLRRTGPTAATLARAEGLEAHALSVDLRLRAPQATEPP